MTTSPANTSSEMARSATSTALRVAFRELELYDTGDVAGADEVFAPDLIDHNASSDGASRTANGETAHKRPTRDSLQGERAPGAAGGRRRVVIDSQASRRAPGGGPPTPRG